MIYTKTALGQQAFKERSALFSARQRTAFIMFDGHKSVAYIMQATTGLGLTQADVDAMVAHGFLVPLDGSDGGVTTPP